MRLQRGAGLRDSVVMHHRGIGAIGGDGVKAFSQAERLLPAQGGEHLRHVAFGYGFPARIFSSKAIWKRTMQRRLSHGRS